MTRILEKMSLLGLSLLLISAFSISTALPPMLDYYSPTFSAAQVELLVSVPSFSVVAMLLLNSFIDKWLSDRQLIVTGLLLLSSAGIFPFFVQAYPLVLLSRIAFGMGIGLINAKAIAIISQRYQGKERVQMLGIRGSMGTIISNTLYLRQHFAVKNKQLASVHFKLISVWWRNHVKLRLTKVRISNICIKIN